MRHTHTLPHSETHSDTHRLTEPHPNPDSHTQTHRDTHKHTHAQPDTARQTQTHTETHTPKQTQTHPDTQKRISGCLQNSIVPQTCIVVSMVFRCDRKQKKVPSNVPYIRGDRVPSNVPYILYYTSGLLTTAKTYQRKISFCFIFVRGNTFKTFARDHERALMKNDYSSM